jgi:peptide/nickel transport system permease protein
MNANDLANDIPLDTAVEPPPSRPWVILLRRVSTSWQGMFGLTVLALTVLVALTANLLAPFSPIDPNMEQILAPPSAAHWFGTDELGRDVFSRVLFGARVSLQVVIAAVGLALVAGSTIGLLSGWLGGCWDTAIMRCMDALLAFPFLVLALAIIAILGPDLGNAMLAIAITKTPGFARLVRSEVLALKNVDYVKATVALGASDLRILARHVWPNVAGNVIVYGSLAASQALVTESALSFLGLGAQPPTPSWGSMIATGMDYAASWWCSFFPGLAIFLVVLAFNLLGDACRDALDARLGEH